MAEAKKNVGAILPTASTHKQLQCAGSSLRGAKWPKEKAILPSKWQTLKLLPSAQFNDARNSEEHCKMLTLIMRGLCYTLVLMMPNHVDRHSLLTYGG